MNKIKNWFLKMSLIKKIILIIVIFAVGYFAISKLFLNKNGKITYQTEKAVKGNLVVTVTGSGTVASTNSSNITTEATGVVKNIYVKDGDIVKTGDKIAELELDLEGQQKSSQAWASYQSAKNSLQTTKDSLFSTQASYVGRLHNFAHVDLSGVEVNALSLIEEVHFVLVKPEIQGRLGRVIQHAEVRLVPNIEEIAPKSVIIDDDTQLQMINPASL